MESMADGCLDIEEMAVNRLHLIIRGQTMSCRIDVMKKATHNLKKRKITSCNLGSRMTLFESKAYITHFKILFSDEELKISGFLCPYMIYEPNSAHTQTHPHTYAHTQRQLVALFISCWHA